MILETAQLLSTAHCVLGNDGKSIENFYKPTHVNHPSAVWVRQSSANYEWALQHLESLCNEYTHRYGKIHKTEQEKLTLLSYIPDNITDEDFTIPPQCMPDVYRQNDTVQAYRDYYAGAKLSFATWTKRDVPIWFKHKVTTFKYKDNHEHQQSV